MKVGRGQRKSEGEGKSMRLSVLCAAYYTTGLPYSAWGGGQATEAGGMAKSLVYKNQQNLNPLAACHKHMAQIT